ncbi:MAG: hypothetical protein ACI8WT_003976 [Clostridium sp.]|jgi:hypothetical protein
MRLINEGQVTTMKEVNVREGTGNNFFIKIIDLIGDS